MKSFPPPALLIFAVLCLAGMTAADEPKKPSTNIPPVDPKQERPITPEPKPENGTTMGIRSFLIGTKWTWRNVRAGVPDRECLFMPDGTFRHPNFTAKFTVKDPHTVVLTRKGGKAVLTFDMDFKNFEAVDFNNTRITGSRL